MFRIIVCLVACATPLWAQFTSAHYVGGVASVPSPPMAPGPVVGRITGGPAADFVYVDITANAVVVYVDGALGPSTTVLNLPIVDVIIDVYVDDLDSDGVDDILTANVGGILTVLLSRPTGFQQTAYAVGLDVYSGIWWPINFAKVCDYDVDGDLDIVGMNRVALNDGSGGFGTASFTTGYLLYYDPALMADFDADGDIDAIAYSGSIFGAPVVVRNDGPLGWTTLSQLSFGAVALKTARVAEIDGNPGSEIVTLSQAGVIGVMTWVGNAFTLPVPRAQCTACGGSPIAGVLWDLIVFDGDGNGRDDIAVLNTNGMTILGTTMNLVAYQTNPLAPFILIPSVPSEVIRRATPADVDDDGDQDLLIVHAVGAAPSVYEIAWLESPIPSPPVLQMTVVSGANQTTAIFQAAAVPLIVEVRSVATGAPVAGVVVGIGADVGVSTSPASSAITDAGGQATITLTAGTQGGVKSIELSTFGAATITTSLIVDPRLLVLNHPPTSPSIFILYYHEHAGVPLIVAADLPQLPVTHSFGTIATSVLAPGPGFLALDGLGLFGPANPSVATFATNPPRYSYAAAVPAVLFGQTYVFQVYGLDTAYAYPASIVVSNFVTITL